jgi:putative nucleotidyltransferase with HDIG domain
MIDHEPIPDAVDLPEPFQAIMLKRLESADLDLPLLPTLAWELIAMIQADDVDAQHFADLIHRDQALAGHVLRLANSAAFRPRLPIVSLQQAVNRLGTSQLAELAFAVALRSRVFHVPGYESDMRDLWAHSMATAAYGKEIAHLARTHAEGAFLCGLLHDIGKPIMLQLLIDLQKELQATLAPQLVRLAMDAYHVLAGSRLATSWNLPLHVVESIMYHHHQDATPVCVEAVAITRLADAVAYHILTPETDNQEPAHLLSLLADLNCDGVDLHTILAKREEVLRLVGEMI